MNNDLDTVATGKLKYDQNHFTNNQPLTDVENNTMIFDDPNTITDNGNAPTDDNQSG